MGIVIFKVGKKSGTATVHEKTSDLFLKPDHGFRKVVIDSIDEEYVKTKDRGEEQHPNIRRSGTDGQSEI